MVLTGFPCRVRKALHKAYRVSRITSAVYFVISKHSRGIDCTTRRLCCEDGPEA